MRHRVAVYWSTSSFFGGGVCACNLALRWANDPDLEQMSSAPVNPGDIAAVPRAVESFEAFRRRSERPAVQFGQGLWDQ
jgi:hypothetical protein